MCFIWQPGTVRKVQCIFHILLKGFVDVASPATSISLSTKRFVEMAGNTSVLYESISRGGSKSNISRNHFLEITNPVKNSKIEIIFQKSRIRPKI